MINIGFIHNAFPVGGAEMVTSNLSTYLTKEGYNVFVFASEIRENMLTDTDKQNITSIEVNGRDTFFKDSEKELIQQIKKHNIQILIFVGAIQFNIKGIIEQTKCRSIFAYHGTPFWEIEDEKEYLHRELYAKKKNIFSNWKHIYYKIPKKLSKKKEQLIKTFLEIYNTCDAFTVLCDPYKEIMQKELQQGILDKLHTIPNGILPPPIQYSLHKEKQLLYLGRMSYADKRIDRLIEVWKNIYQKFPDWELILVGDGAEKENLRELANKYKLERIYFHDAIKTPYKYYNKASILCMTSQFEGIPLVLLEAQQAGVIPIAFNCSKGVESVLTPSKTNGILIEDFNLDSYQRELSGLMKDKDLQEHIKQNIILKSDSYSIENIGRKWHKLFQSLMKTN